MVNKIFNCNIPIQNAVVSGGKDVAYPTTLNVPYCKGRTRLVAGCFAGVGSTIINCSNAPFLLGDASRAFMNCKNLTTTIYNLNLTGVTNMAYTFYGCTKFNQNIVIPNNIVNLYYTFSGCSNMKQNLYYGCANRFYLQDIGLAYSSVSITNASYAFYKCTNLRRGWPFSSTGITSTPANMSFCFAECYNYNTYISYGYFTNTVNLHYTFCRCYNLKVSINNVFVNCNTIVDCNRTFFNTGILNAVNAFNNCSNLIYAEYCFYNCPSLTDIGNCFQNCGNLINITNCFANSYNLTNIGYCFYNCNNINSTGGTNGTIYFHSSKITSAPRIFSNKNTYRKDIYIYFTYTNGVKTATWNAFSTSLWYYANGKANAKAKNILTNRRNCYVWNLGSTSI